MATILHTPVHDLLTRAYFVQCIRLPLPKWLYGGYVARKVDQVLRQDQGALRVQVRTTADELRQAADVIADRLNRARGAWTFLGPRKGWSSLDREGRPIYDPVADAAFVARLKEKQSARTIFSVKLDLLFFISSPL